MPDNDIIFNADLNTSDFDSAVDSAVRKAGDFESALDELQSALDGVDAGISVDIQANVAENADLTNLLSLETYSPDVQISTTIADNTELTNLIALEAYSPDVAVSTTVEDDPDIDALNKLDAEKLTPVVDTQQTREGEEVVNAIDRLARLQVIDIAMNVGGNVMSVLSQIQQFTVTPFLDAEDAAAGLAARTGEGADAIRKYQDAILSIQQDDLGESAGQIGQVMETALQLGAPMEDATRAALGFTKVFYEQDPVEVLNAMNALVSTGLVGSFQEAGDLLITAFQGGANRGGDLLDTIRENAITFKQMGLDGEASLSLITSGMEEGFAQSTFVADSIKTLQGNLIAAADDPSGDIGKTFKKLGIDNPAETGEAYGADFVQSVIDAIKAQPIADQASIAALLFGEQGAIATEGILNLSTSGFGDTEGAIADAGQTVDDTLRAQIDKFKLELKSVATEFLSSDQIDLPGKLEAIKNGIKGVIEGLQNGETLGEAIEMGFKIEGVDEFMTRFESIVGNLAISFLELIAGIQDLMGKDSTGTRANIANLAANQLSFDLKAADANAMSGIIRTAIDRGVQESTLMESASTAINESAASGDLEQAQAIVDGLASQTGVQLSSKGYKTFLGDKAEINVPFDPEMSQEAYDQFVKDTQTRLYNETGIEYEIKPAAFSPEDLQVLQEQVTAASSDFLNTNAQSRAGEDDIDTYKKMKSAADDASSAMSDLAEQNSIVNDALKKNKKAWEDAEPVVSDFNDNMADGVITTEEASGAIKLAGMYTNDFAETLALAAINAVTMSGEINTMTSKTGALQSLASALQSANLAGLAVQANLGTVPTGGGGSGSNVTVNQNIVVNSEAEGASTAAQTANALRGFQ